MFVGAAGRWRWLLPVHIGLMLAGGVPLLAIAAATRLRTRRSARARARRRRLRCDGHPRALPRRSSARSTTWRDAYVIRNPTVVPTSMNEEGRGPKSPFFPSSADTNVKRIIPADFFMTSAACARCHQGIYDEWKSSMHHFSSFNNQWYRKSIEYMQDAVGTTAVEMVRRLPRSCGVLQRPLRPSDQGTDRHARGAGRSRVHVVPFDHARSQHDGPGRFRDRVPAAARSRGERPTRCCEFVARPADVTSIRSRTVRRSSSRSTATRRRSSARAATRFTSTCR